MKSKRLLFQLRALERHTDAIGSGLLLTPNTTEIEQTPETQVARRKRNGYKNGTKWGSLASQVKFGMLPTPQAMDASGKGREPRLKKDMERDPALLGSYRVDLKDTIVGSGSGLKLQPNFAAWMMGYPPGWATLPSPNHSIAKSSSKPTATL
jgi:hypothetical protein